MLVSQLLPWHFQIDSVAIGDRLGHLLVVVGAAVRPRREGPFADRQRRIGHDQVRVDLHLRAQAGAAVACAVRRVEREDPRLELDQRRSVLGAGETLGEGEDRAPLGHLAGNYLRRRGARALGPLRALGLLPILRRRILGRIRGAADGLELDQPFRAGDCCLDRIGQALAHVVAHHETVDDDRDVVLVALVEHDRLLEHAHAVVYLHAREAFVAQLVEQLAVLPLASAHDRGQHHEARAVGQLHRLVDDLLGRLPDDRAPADRAVRLAHARPQQAQVVIDLRNRSDRRARVARGRLLVDRDRRRKALDRVDVGLVHLAEELARISRQRLDVASLPLGVDRVERQRALARAGQARDHHQRVARQRKRDVLQVVLAGT